MIRRKGKVMNSRKTGTDLQGQLETVLLMRNSSEAKNRIFLIVLTCLCFYLFRVNTKIVQLNEMTGALLIVTFIIYILN